MFSWVLLWLCLIWPARAENDPDIGPFCRYQKTKQLIPSTKVQILEKTIDFESPALLLGFYHELNQFNINLHPADENVLVTNSIDNAVLFGDGYQLGLQSLNEQILISRSTFYYQEFIPDISYTLMFQTIQR